MQPERDEFVINMEKRFSEYLKSEDDEVVGYAEFFVYGSQQYEIEEEAYAFLKGNPTPTPQDLIDFFRRTAPYGLAPGDDGADLLDDE